MSEIDENNFEILIGPLLKFLKKNVRDKSKNEAVTHTVLFAPGDSNNRAYHIKDEDLPKLYDLYYKIVEKGYSYPLIERPKEISCFSMDIDFDFEYKKEYRKRQYTEKNLKDLIRIVRKVLRKYYIVTNKELMCFVSEKSKPTEDKEKKRFKDGFHFHFPYMAMCSNMRRIVTNDTLKKVIKMKTFDNIPFNNDISKVIDESIIMANGLYIVGAKKMGRKSGYRLTHVYNHKGKEQNKDIYTKRDLLDILSNRKYPDGYETTTYVEDFDYNIICDKIKKKKPETKKQSNKLKEYKMEEIEKVDIDKLGFRERETIEYAQKLVKMLDVSRAEEYKDWIPVGWALHNTSIHLLDTFIEFSKRCPDKYKPGECEKIWGDAKDTGYTILSLRSWAKKDSPEEYKELSLSRIHELIKTAESGTERHIAKVAYELKRSEFKCTSISGNEWFQFKNGKWINVEAGYTLDEVLSEEIVREFTELNSFYMDEMNDHEAQMREYYSKKSINICKIIMKLNGSSFKNGVMKECAKLFYDNKFTSNLDSNVDLIGFDDGVYDLANGEFRKGRPEDMVTFSTGYDYPKHYDYDHPDVQWVEDFFDKIHRNKNVNLYTKIKIASCLDGRVSMETFDVWHGGGANGKSKVMEFNKYAFGDYYYDIPVAALTSHRSSHTSADPILADLKGKRSVSAQEPEKHSQFNVAFIKELSGGDEITARKLYKEPTSFKPQCKITIACNDIPKLSSGGYSLERRMIITGFNSTFVKIDKNGRNSKTGRKLKENEFPRDNKLAEKLKKYKRAYIWLLINKYYPMYRDNDYTINEPIEVLNVTKEYHKSNDICQIFLDEEILVTDDNEDFLGINFLYSKYKKWHKMSGYTEKQFKKTEFKDELLKKEFKIDNNNVFGIKLIPYDFDSEI